jgi:uncharacterized lipoprotein YddW (UPF0748 family)
MPRDVTCWFAHRQVKGALVLLACCANCWAETSTDTEEQAPPLRREFRAAWVATVANIDWPSKPGLTTEQQKQEMVALLDDAVRMNLNAIVLQVRPSCDAIYNSKLEPWTEFLTGTMGQAPEPYYDPLEFAVAEAHKRGIELHAWFNPYRTRSTGNTKPAADTHVSKTHPEIVKQYGDYHWMDPGEGAAFDHTMAVIRDVVERYDIDGVHMDDYFYPYPVNIEKTEGDKTVKELVPFPDDASWEKAVQAGTELSRDDWRRENINRLVQQIHDDVRQLKPWVKFGISPFGIGRPGKPPQIKGFDQYESLYADTQKWFKEGWVDYFTPQLYWRIGPPEQSYAALLDWWHKQNQAKRHLWPGNFTSRLLEGDRKDKQWDTDELIAQIWVTRAQQGATGNVHFSMKALSRNARGVGDELILGPYREPALIPESPWLAGSEDAKPDAPKFKVKKSGGQWVVTRDKKTGDKPWLWVVKTRQADNWHFDVVPGSEQSRELNFLPKGAAPEAIAVSVVDRIGRESELSWYKRGAE